MIAIPVIRRHLTSDLLGRHIYLFGTSTVSAGAVLRRLADAGAQEGAVVLVEDEESRIHAAALFRPVLRLGAVGSFASIATLALAEAVEGPEGTGPTATPVWPDRVDIADTTVGTTFVESAAADRPDFVILGVSVDVRALEAAAGRAYDSNALVAAWLNALDRWATVYAARGPAAVMGAVRFRPRGSVPHAVEPQKSL